MNKSIAITIAVLASVLILLACQKDDAIAAITGQPTTCGHDGARIHASIAGSEWCASTSVIATASSATLSATGISTPGGTITFGIDSMRIGTQPVTEGANSALFVDVGGNYTVATGDPGQLIITEFDAVAHHVKGTMSVKLHLNGTGAAKQVNADFDLAYTAQ